MYTIGIDIGSTACKAVALKDGKEIVGSSIIQTGTGTSGPGRVYEDVFKAAGLMPEGVSRIVVTGYGRLTFEKADNQISELSCHAKGVHFLMPQARTIIDIGGQDAKALKLSPAGTLTGFVMNDKCAAGTGRFLDVMAKILEVDVGELAELSSRSTERISISNVCTVFAESEVISQLAAGKKREDIAAGIHMSVANRVAGLARRVGIEPDVVLTGGVAQNLGVIRAMSEILEMNILPAPMPQLTGALGAAIFAYDEAIKLK
ncbi:MAG: 2-hydroxyglutaryl-CoA dehydratase [Firmicutes bacterium HGW-Firmicutes-16]|nr:MAG: 2-hydroxyglutaryl-CoA dehydratase [Firmicutes bacterium HGW-Firmicutes-16]